MSDDFSKLPKFLREADAAKTRHPAAIVGRGGAGNFVTANPLPMENLPAEYTQKPVAGNFSGRGGIGNFKGPASLLPMSPAQSEQSAFSPSSTEESQRDSVLKAKGGRGGAGNIEAVTINHEHAERKQIEIETAEIDRVHAQMALANSLPGMPERPILRID